MTRTTAAARRAGVRAVAASRQLASAARTRIRRLATTADHGTPRRLSYAPDLDGAADPGEVVWTLVAYEDDPSQAKDRPVLVVGRKDDRTVLALMLSSSPRRRHDRGWLALGKGGWDAEQRDSFVRMDRVLELDEDALRREGAVLPRDRFEQVATALRQRYDWS